MKKSNAIAAIDIGSTKVTALVADVNEYGLSLIHI